MQTAVARRLAITATTTTSRALSTEHQKQLMARGLPKQRSIPGVTHVICVASGKGGVGKSTLAANLALTLANRLELRVGLLDADIYGPSVPQLLNLVGHEPQVDEAKLLVPLRNFNVACMSMGFLVGEKAPIVWRGLMVMQAVERLMFGVRWSPLDLLVVDMPPGTGDVHLSVAQHLRLAGCVVVSTPQELALIDARRAIEMFAKLKVPCLGLVQNMSAHVCAKCGHEEFLFGREGVTRLAEEVGAELLGDVPLDAQLRATSDSGRPLVVEQPEHAVSRAYLQIATAIKNKLAF